MSRYQSEDDTQLNTACYEEGRVARDYFKNANENPYTLGSDERWAWEAGYYDEDAFLRGYLA